MIPFLLIPLLAILNHEGGQNTFVPDPRIVFRVILIPIAFAIFAYLTGHPTEISIASWAITTIGMGLWAIPGWASGFCCVGDGEDGRQDTWLGDIVNYIMNVNYLTKLTQEQCKEWGVIYFTLRGLYLYPLFIALAYLFTPWALLIGSGSQLMGIVYANAKTVYNAEFIMGALIGAMLAGVLWLS